jgi:hypothetical protein
VTDGAADGASIGESVGESVGDAVGAADGASVGNSVRAWNGATDGNTGGSLVWDNAKIVRDSSGIPVLAQPSCPRRKRANWQARTRATTATAAVEREHVLLHVLIIAMTCILITVACIMSLHGLYIEYIYVAKKSKVKVWVKHAHPFMSHT